jgi:hypothetical protein
MLAPFARDRVSNDYDLPNVELTLAYSDTESDIENPHVPLYRPVGMEPPPYSLVTSGRRLPAPEGAQASPPAAVEVLLV